VSEPSNLPPRVAIAPAVSIRPAVAKPSLAPALAQLRSRALRTLAEVQYRVQRLGGAGLTGIALLLAAGVLFCANNLPQSAAVAALKAQLVRAAPQIRKPAISSPGAAPLASLPTRAVVPTVVAKILEEAQASGVELQRGQYEFIPARDGVAARYRMDFPVKTTYPKLREFMDRTLLALPAVAVDGIRIERKSVADDAVDGELKLSVFVRSTE